jgi:hypothetical protein
LSAIETRDTLSSPFKGTADMSKLIDGTIPNDVLNLCAKRGNLAHLRSAIRLASEHFKSIRNVEIRVQLDPDSDVQRVIVDLALNGEIEEALVSQRAFYGAWAQTVPPSQQETVRLLYAFT